MTATKLIFCELNFNQLESQVYSSALLTVLRRNFLLVGCRIIRSLKCCKSSCHNINRCIQPHVFLNTLGHILFNQRRIFKDFLVLSFRIVNQKLSKMVNYNTNPCTIHNTQHRTNLIESFVTFLKSYIDITLYVAFRSFDLLIKVIRVH